MTKPERVAFLIRLVVCLAELGVRAAASAVGRRAPGTTGRRRLPGLQAPVEVLWDAWGVPHVYATSAEDLFMAQGYLHAQERLWQMELQRRIGAGRLAELLGASALPTDRIVRVVGLHRVARREAELLTGEARLAVDRYVEGVNGWLRLHGRRLPIELGLLGAIPEPWAASDVLAWGKVMAFSLDGNWPMELLRARLIAAHGEERAAALDPSYPSRHPAAVRELDHGADSGSDWLRLWSHAEPPLGSSGGEGSNAWALAGSRTASGAPLLANDPHLQVQVPSLWYENHLIGGGYAVTGASLPGMPGVVIGHNEKVAWGVTNARVDTQDVYVEQFDPEDRGRYRWRGGWRRSCELREEIVVRGRPRAHVEHVRVTCHGPVISPLLSEEARDAAGPAMALRWTALDPGRLMAAMLAINRSRDWHEFRAALADWSSPAQNFVYADVGGNIGCALAGTVPVRARGDGRAPVPGWTAKHEWRGVLFPDRLPSVLNPSDGFVVTANNRIVDDAYPHPLPGEWASDYRAERIRQLITARARHDVETTIRMQGDTLSLPGLELASLASRLPVTTALHRVARDLLMSWDGVILADSSAAAIYSQLRERLLRAAYQEAAEPLGLAAGLGTFTWQPGRELLALALPHILRRAALGEDGWLPTGRRWDQVLSVAWAETVETLRDQLGPDPLRWGYGRLHRLDLRHPLGGLPVIGRLLNAGAFPTDGDGDTVCAGQLTTRADGSAAYVGPFYRQVCDLADWDASRSVNLPGQSGRPGTRHYADLTMRWRTLRHHPMLWSRRLIEDSAASRSELLP